MYPTVKQFSKFLKNIQIKEKKNKKEEFNHYFLVKIL